VEKEITLADLQIVAEPGVPQIVITRWFAASPEALFRAHTEPDLLVRWLGPRRLSMVIDRYELRDGGVWRYVNREEDGTEYAFHGVFHGTPSVAGIVQTFEFEGWPGHVSLETLTFERRGDKTLVRNNAVYQSVEDRDAMVQSGMEAGIVEGYDRLDELLASGRAGV
jgi:uncharacterized protein YndB with AHSA1/START domain